jgi:hypothetical protein
MSQVAIPQVEEQIEEHRGSQHGGGFRYLIQFGAAAVIGCLLFAVGRKLTWGVDEPLLGFWLFVLAFCPYLASAAIVQGLRIEDRGPSLVYPTGLASVWTLSLVLYVVVHVTGASFLIDDPIYHAFGLSSRAFGTLSVVYAIAAAVLAHATLAVRRLFVSRDAMPPGMDLPTTAIGLGALLCIPMLYGLLFSVPLQN